MRVTIVNTILALALGALLFLAGTHVYHDHQQHHFNTVLLEAVRQAVIEKHPELLEAQ
jgi:type II secretory pathway component PulJ